MARGIHAWSPGPVLLDARSRTRRGGREGGGKEFRGEIRSRSAACHAVALPARGELLSVCCGAGDDGSRRGWGTRFQVLRPGWFERGYRISLGRGVRARSELTFFFLLFSMCSVLDGKGRRPAR